MIYDLQQQLIGWFDAFEFYDDAFAEYVIEIITCIPWVVLVFLALLPLRWIIDFLFGGNNI